MKDQFPKVDLIIISHVLLDWPLDVRKLLITKAYDALPQGGTIIICDELIEDDPCRQPLALLTSIFMQVTTKGGSYNYDQCR
jgi:hypothetical protein